MQTITANNYSVYFDSIGYETLASLLIPSHYSKIFILVIPLPWKLPLLTLPSTK